MFRLQAPLPESYRQASPQELASRISEAKSRLGEKVFILGHHYQQDEVMDFADARGDSLALSRLAGEQTEAEYIVFCGVHFMAEAADILTSKNQNVILPDLNAGCSMADMADLDTVEDAWEELSMIIDTSRVVPITYMNSSAALKAFVGNHGGAVCTSSNAKAILLWALDRGDQVLFFPDQHLGRNTAFQLGYTAQDMLVWDPRMAFGGNGEEKVKSSTFLLWKGHCSVHQRFEPRHVEDFRMKYPLGTVIVHPECAHEVVELADQIGSTDAIIKAVSSAPSGSVFGIGTEIHLVHRLSKEHPDMTIESLDPLVCPCATMFRIDARHLAWILEGLVEGKIRNQIVVDPDIAQSAKIALERMLKIV